jgi:ribonucleoside-diphosphate reductase alpha chain
MTAFKSSFSENIFRHKYALSPSQPWADKARSIVNDVCGTGTDGKQAPILSKSERDELTHLITHFKFLPGGRYIYYAGRPARFWNNCFLLRGEEDTREEWGALAQRAFSCLMVGGGIGVDYSVFRPEGSLLSRTGGVASGPIPLMKAINEIGRNVCQGGSRRSAIYGSLNWQHDDADPFLHAKDWRAMPIGKAGYTVWDAKADDFNFTAPLDGTNISLNYDDDFLSAIDAGTLPATYVNNIRQALMTGEPGLSFNFGAKCRETLRNACCELTSEDDSDVCNLGSANLGAIDSLEELRYVVDLAAKFLICGTVRGQLPYDKVHAVRGRNRRIGLGLMGLHEWLLKRGYRYEFTPELHEWFAAYRDESESGANAHCDRLYLSRPKGYRAIAPTGTIAILAGTTSGIEPLYSVAYKRRYLVDATQWRYEYVVDTTAKILIDQGINPDAIETAADLAGDPERRIKFQYDAQQYVDHAISSTVNLPAWGSDGNNEDSVLPMAQTLAKYAHGLRGFTCYPDGARGGQPIIIVPYADAKKHAGVIYEENGGCPSGACGV